MIKGFPKFESHQVASCFNCMADLNGDQWSKSGYVEQCGQFMQTCEKCQMSTWYDLTPQFAIHFINDSAEDAMRAIAQMYCPP